MEPNEIVRALRAHHQSLTSYQLGNEFADAVNDAADCIEKLLEEIHNATVHADCMEAKASAYQAELERVIADRDAAIQCIENIDDANSGTGYNAVDEVIAEWQSSRRTRA